MIKIELKDWAKWNGKGKTLAVFAFEEEVPADAKADGFKGKELSTLLYRPLHPKPSERVLFIGLGKKTELTDETLRKAATRALRGAEALSLQHIDVQAPSFSTPSSLQAFVEGLYLGTYRFDRHKSSDENNKSISSVTVWLEGASKTSSSTVEKARIYSEATMLARDLINEPPSRMNPARLAEEAAKAIRSPLTIKVFETKELEKLGMGAILGVGVGGLVPPRLVEIIYKPAKKAKKIVALVGKGITFDSGGLSLKPAASMETMKDDMSGAAAVLGVMTAVAQLQPDVEVRGYMAIAENMPGGKAQKPGDVVKAFNGKTIEVLNTDAEGRLVLSDALSYACSKKPDVVIDIATLTGACVVALGHKVSAVMTNTPELYDALREAGNLAGEKFWELPLEKEYAGDVKSKIADLQNIGKRRGEAGTIIGGLFLQEFVDGRPWAHIDIAGPSWTDSDQPYCPTGGTGHPVRTLLHYIESL